MACGGLDGADIAAFQCSSASRKFLNRLCAISCDMRTTVSVLFSEPKIPQHPHCGNITQPRTEFQCSSASRKFLNIGAMRSFAPLWTRFSALQRAENSSIETPTAHNKPHYASFSALQRAENSSIQRVDTSAVVRRCFSALQRAENSSIRKSFIIPPETPSFQCSSASRKFLNSVRAVRQLRRTTRFSALQRAENSSMKGCGSADNQSIGVSVLFSEPKIPQCWCCPASSRSATVSVLFSEPKIPQFGADAVPGVEKRRFSALQRAENSSI